MAPSILNTGGCDTDEKLDSGQNVSNSAILHPNMYSANPRVVSAKGNYFELDTGQKILDATGGPAVACIGHGNVRIRMAVMKQMEQLSFCHSLYWSNSAAEMLARELISSTDGKMARVTLYGSGSEAIEAAMKLARQYYVELSQPNRSHFIARQGSFHGTTLGSLSLTEQNNKRKQFEPLLPGNVSFVSACHPYRGQKDGETLDEYCHRLAEELDNEFTRLGGDTVCAFVAETVAGSVSHPRLYLISFGLGENTHFADKHLEKSLGCVPAVPGYFQAIKTICEKHGALLILDEVMCGIGRTGTFHAWQQEGVVPDIQMIAKGLGGGYAPISALLMNQKVIHALEQGAQFFNHGHTYQSHAVACAAALEVQNIIRTQKLVENVAEMEEVFGVGLKFALGHHPNVGDVRGRGLMWAIEFVKDKATKEPFPAADRTAMLIRKKGLQPPYNISLQPGMGTVDGVVGDHIMLAPAYNVTREDIDLIIAKTAEVVTEFFATKI